MDARGVTIQVTRILVAIDHSTGSDAIVEYACAVARGVGASISLLHVYEPPNAMIGIVPGATVGAEAAAEQDAGSALLDRAAALCAANGVAPVARSLERGSASDTIVQRATAGRYDLVVMGTHARTGVSRLVMGSVAEKVLRSAPCPVLMVHLQPQSG